MFARKLKALGYPNVDGFNVADVKQLQNLIIWVEDQKIRHYRIEDRENLRDVTDEQKWRTTYNKYLKDLLCPHTDHTDTNVIIDWLLGFAVRLSYGDDPEKYRKCTGSSSSTTNGVAASANPLDSLDYDDPAMKAGIVSLAALLQIPPHDDHRQVLKAMCSLVKERLSKEALSQQQQQASTSSADQLTLDTLDMGFSTGDYVTEEAVKILRLLHIQNLRELQSQINEAVVSVQKVTADPKTDQRLGKIGR